MINIKLSFWTSPCRVSYVNVSACQWSPPLSVWDKKLGVLLNIILFHSLDPVHAQFLLLLSLNYLSIYFISFHLHGLHPSPAYHYISPLDYYNNNLSLDSLHPHWTTSKSLQPESQQLGKMKKFWEMDAGEDCAIVWMCLISLLYTRKRLKW